MSEVYTEDWDDDEFEDDIYEEIDALQERLDEQDEVAIVNAAIRSLEAAHGSPFSHDDVQQLGELIDQGHDPVDVYQYVEPAHGPQEAFDDAFVDTAERIQEEQGRSLAQSEVDTLYDRATFEGDPRWIEPDVLRDMGNRKDRIAAANERHQEHDPPEEAPEYVEPLSEDATPKERIEYLDARHSGAEVVDTDYETGE